MDKKLIIPIYDTVKVKVPEGILPIIIYVENEQGNYKEICLNPDTNCYVNKNYKQKKNEG